MATQCMYSLYIQEGYNALFNLPFNHSNASQKPNKILVSYVDQTLGYV